MHAYIIMFYISHFKHYYHTYRFKSAYIGYATLYTLSQQKHLIFDSIKIIFF
jgi:hypothetical protein